LWGERKDWDHQSKPIDSNRQRSLKHSVKFVLAGLLLASLAVHVVERRRIASLLRDHESLRAELAVAQQTIAKAGVQSGPQNEELERLRAEAREVHKLRNEVSQLRTGTKEVDQLRAENQKLRGASRAIQPAPSPGVAPSAAASQDGYFAKETWTFTGYATPEAALQSAIWAMREGDTKTLLASLAPEEMARMQKEWGNKSEAQVSADAKRGTDKIAGIRILESRILSDDEVVLSVYAMGGEDKVQKISMKRYGAEWKMAGPKRE